MNRADVVWEILSGRRAPVSPASPLQRPGVFCPGLENKPWHDPSRFDWIADLEAAHEVILGELESVLSQERGFQQYREPRPGVEFTTLHDTGDWNVFYFYFEGRWFEENRAACPETARLIQSIPRRAGLACFSALEPGTHIRPHAAPFNITLRCHLGLMNLDSARMRVGEETRSWERGKALVIDDSFEHEVWVDGPGPRVILIVDFFHPDLTDEEVTGLQEMWRSPEAQSVLAPWYQLVGADKKR